MDGGLRSIVSDEIAEYILELTQGHGNSSQVPAFIESVDKKAFVVIVQASAHMAQKALNELRGLIGDRIPNEEVDHIIETYVKRSVAGGLTIGWLLEHLSRNNLELLRTPSLRKYVEIGIESKGKLDHLASILQESKLTKEEHKVVADFDEFMSLVGNSSADESATR